MMVFIVTMFHILLTCCNRIVTPERIKIQEEIILQPQLDVTSVLFYNVENLFDTIDDPYKNDEEFLPNGKLKWSSKRYFAKLKNMSQVISACPTPLSIVGLAEIENKKVVEELFKTGDLKNKNYKVISEESADERGIDVALIFDATLFTEVQHQAIAVFFEDAPNDKTRDVLYVQLKNKQNENLHLFVNHWPSRKEGVLESEVKRRTAARVVKRKIVEIQSKDKNAKIIIMGDFNDNPTDKSIEDMIGTKLSKSKKVDFIGLLSDEYAAGIGTEVYKDSWNLFDQLIVSKSIANAENGFSINPNSCMILKKDFMLYKSKKNDAYFPSRTYGGEKYFGGYSDHLPVYLLLDNLLIKPKK